MAYTSTAKSKPGVINIGNLLRRTHNVVVVHHLQTWADRDAFRENLSHAYQKAHPGEEYSEHLARTIYALANNFWEADFRLIETGLEVEHRPAQAGDDADGLDLEPRPS